MLKQMIQMYTTAFKFNNLQSYLSNRVTTKRWCNTENFIIKSGPDPLPQNLKSKKLTENELHYLGDLFLCNGEATPIVIDRQRDHRAAPHVADKLK
jgi:hypothetical protein